MQDTLNETSISETDSCSAIVPGQQVQGWVTDEGSTLQMRHAAASQRHDAVSYRLSAQDARPAVVERALDALAEVVVVGGGEFLSRRWRVDAWPQLARLLREGPAFRRWATPHGP